MKKIMAILAISRATLCTAQIDLSCDASFIGVHANAQISYPIADKVVVGGSYGYNMTQYLLSDRIDLVLGWKPNEWIQLEGHFGVITGYDTQEDKILAINKQCVFHFDIGVKGHFLNNMFYTVQVANPGFIKFGLGVRLRPYKQLTIWDKQ